MVKEIGFVDKMLSIAGLMRKGAIGPLPGDRVIWKTLRELLGTQGAVLNKPYEQSIWVYSAITAIATNIARVPFVIKRDIGAGLSKKIEEGAIYDLFLNPNPLMSQRQPFEATMIFLSLQGEAIWILEGRENITQLPKEIWTFSPARFKPVQSKQGMVVGWTYDNGSGELIPLANHEIIFFRYFNPYDDIRGMPPIKAAQENINQDYYATKYNSAFFKNSAVVSGFITVEGELTDEQFNRTLRQFEDRHQGYEKAHKIALLEGGGKFEQATISQKDMEFIEGKKLTKQEILAAFKVNEVVLGIFDSIKSYLGIKAADKAFWEETLMPKTHYIEDHLWAKFFSNIGQRRGKGKIWGEFDLATVGSLQVNYDDKIVTAGRMFTMGWPINAINRRLELGMEDVPWGDMWYVPGGYLPVTMLGKVKPISVPSDLDSGKDLLSEETEKPASSFFELEFRNKIKKFIFEVRKKVLSSIYEDDFTRPDVKKDFDKLISDLQKVYFVTINEAYLEASRQLQKEQKVDKCSPEVVTYISMRIGILTEGFAGLIEDLFNVIEGSTCDKEGKAEKVRMVFNAITQKSLILAKGEAAQATEFGKSLFIQNSFGAAINYLKEG